jgi:hypothetical protein
VVLYTALAVGRYGALPRAFGLCTPVRAANELVWLLDRIATSGGVLPLVCWLWNSNASTEAAYQRDGLTACGLWPVASVWATANIDRRHWAQNPRPLARFARRNVRNVLVVHFNTLEPIVAITPLSPLLVMIISRRG